MRTIISVSAMALVFALASCDETTAKPKTQDANASRATSAASRKTEEPIKAPDGKADFAVVKLTTSEGDILLELNRKRAPNTVQNFIDYVKAGFYDDTIFHRVISNFMIQGGGMAPNGVQKNTRKPIQNEADNGLTNQRGTIAMARTGDPHSATSQFFINVVNNTMLDHRSKANGQTWGYCVFGKVKDDASQAVVDKIKATPVTMNAMGENSSPVKPPKIVKAEIVSE